MPLLLIYIPTPETKIFKNSDELFPNDSRHDYVLINAELDVSLSIGSQEAYVWKQLKKGRKSSEIIAKLTMKTGVFEKKKVQKMIDKWLELGLIHKQGKKGRVKKKSWWQKLIWFEISIGNIHQYLEQVYNLIGKYFASKIGMGIVLGIIFSGLILGIYLASMGKVVLLRDLGGGNILIILIIAVASASLHEIGHAMAMIWAKAPVLRAGIALYLGLPVFFVDTSAIWAKSRNKRIVTSSAGVMTNALVAALAVLLTFFFPDIVIQGLLWEVVLINLLQLSLSLVPFLRLDGYYILIDLVGVPSLNKKATEEMKGILTHPMRLEFSRRHNLLLAYGSISLVVSGLMVVYSVYYWWSLVEAVLG